jgi:RAQPRD family integrative conjugative element protein
MKKVLTAALLSLPIATASYAASDQERTALTNLITELELLTKVVNESQRIADPSTDIRFDYPALHADLELIRQGILDHLQKARREPRELPPLSGDYKE